MGDRTVTMKHIANEIGVSAVTISKALSDKDGVSDELRSKIKEKASEMGYRFNSFAKEMKCGVSHNLGILTPERFFGDKSFYTVLYEKLLIDINKNNYSCILEILVSNNEKNNVLPNMIQNNKIDGIIVLGQISRKYSALMSKIDIPIVFLDFYNDSTTGDTVVTDNVYGGYLMTNYLISKGHKKIGFVGNLTNDSTSSVIDRYLGYYKAMMLNDLPVESEWIINDREASGKYIDIELNENLPTAFFCNCDLIAFKVINALKAQGKKVPDDVSVVGFDDHIYAKLSSPQLTTYKVDLDAMCRLTVETIINKINHPKRTNERKIISGTLIERFSVKSII